MQLTIIGGGPGGHTAAFAAAQKGCQVTLIEQAALGGVCLNRGCIPTKTMRASADALLLACRMAEYGVNGCTSPTVSMAVVNQRRQSIVSTLRKGLEQTCHQLKIRLIFGTATIKDAYTVHVHATDGSYSTVTGDALILATGSCIQELPGLSFDHRHIISSDDALELTTVPSRLIIVGGGVIGCELACIYQAFGSSVTIVEGQDRLLPIPAVDADISALLLREMRRRKITVLTGKTLDDVHVLDDMVHGVTAHSPFVSTSNSPETTLTADMALVTVGRAPASIGLGLKEAGIAIDSRGWIRVNEYFETSVPCIYAIGDVLGPSHIMLAHVAAMEGLCALEAILGRPVPMDYSAVPSAIFTVPEIATIGLSETQAKAMYPDVVCSTVHMRSLGKAHAMGELSGLFKLVADAATGKILGIHIAGAHASDIIAEAGLALKKQATLRDIAGTVHAHPTLAEGMFEAARAALHSLTKKQ